MKKSLLFGWLILIVTALKVSAQVSLTNTGTAYQQNFDTLASTGLSSTVPQGWAFAETGANTNGTYSAGTGSSNSGNTYSFGAADAAERAFGGLLSGSLAPSIGASFVNNTGNTITALAVTYTGEQWRLGTAGRADRLNFQYSLDAGTLATGAWTDVDELDFASPVTAGTVGARDGNDAANRRVITFTIAGVNIAPGSTFWFRWQDFDATGADDALAVDNFSLTATGIASNQPLISLSPASLDFGVVNINETVLRSYVVGSSNLTENITVTAASPAFTLSGSPQGSFSNAITLPAEGDTVFVQFAPTTNGQVETEFIHLSGTISKTLPVSGTGYNPLDNLIAITEARTKGVNTLVTVRGRITVANELGGPSFVQDETGGIAVFNRALSESVALGDLVTVTGPIGKFNDQIQISGNSVKFTIEPGERVVPAPKAIALNQLAANEGLLVTVQDAEFIKKTDVLFPESNDTLVSGGTLAILRIDGNTNLPGYLKPQTAVDITGVVGSFRGTAQLLPRSVADVPGLTEPADSADTISKDQTFDIVTWNIAWFGATGGGFGPVNEALQLENARKVIQRLDADVYAFEEISDTTAFRALVNSLPGYRGFYSTAVSNPNGTGPFQRPSFIYKDATVDPVRTQVLLEGVDLTNLPNYPGGASGFWASGRLPFLFVADVTINGVKKRIHLVDVHARANSADNDAGLKEDYLRRRYDVQVLKDTLDAYYANANLVLLGDYNDDVDVTVNRAAGTTETSYKSFVDDSADYRIVTQVLSEAGLRTFVSSDNVIDHIAISSELVDENIPGTTRIEYPFRYIPDYANTTSDHLPVITRFNFPASVVSFTQATAIIEERAGTYTAQLTLSAPSEQDLSVRVTINDNEFVYGKNDYTTSPNGASGFFDLLIPAGSTAVSFTVTPDKNAVKKKFEQHIVFTLTNPSAGLQVGTPNAFTLTVVDEKSNGLHVKNFVVWPNPTTGPITLSTNVKDYLDDKVKVTLRSDQGEILYAGTGYLPVLSYQLSNRLRNGKPGFYLVEVEAGGTLTQIRVLKQ